MTLGHNFCTCKEKAPGDVLDQWFSTKGDFAPLGYMWQYLETCLVVTAGGGDSTTGILGVEATDALNQLVHRSAGFPGGSAVKNLPAVQEMRVRLLVGKIPLNKEIATHFSILAWESPGTEDPGGLQSMGSQLRLNTRQHNSDLAQNANSPEDEKPRCRAVLLDDKV